jgi:cytochrome c553
MSVTASKLSDADIANLVAWFASLELTVKTPE